MGLSIVVPTRNRVNDLRHCVQSIIEQECLLDEYEVIVVDNNSSDGTKETIEEMAGISGRVKYIFAEKAGLHVGRNLGIRESKFDWVAFLDDDVILPWNWVGNVLNLISQNQSELLFGSKVLPLFTGKVPVWLEHIWNVHNLVWELSIINPGDKLGYIEPLNVFGCSFIANKVFLIEIGGFHPDGMPWELRMFRGDGESFVSRKVEEIGKKALFSPEIITYHKVPVERMTLKYFKKKHYLSGISDAFFELRKRKTLALLQKKPGIVRLIKAAKNHYLNNNRGQLNNFQIEQLRFSYLDGYNYLIKKYKEDERVFDWINKLDYFYD